MSASTSIRADPRLVAERAARQSYGKLIALLAAHTRDLAAAEDALSDAFASALEDWPVHGCPANPEAWLLTVARRKSIDTARRRHRGDVVNAQLRLLAEQVDDPPEDLPDRRLALMFACAHPAVDAAVRAPLMLQVVLGLDGKSIASAFLVSPAAMSKRLVRAKERIREAGIAFDVPSREELPARLDSVLEAIYAAFAEGWADPSGTDVVRRELSEEAIFLARLVVELLPDAAEARGLLALMLHAEARRGARRDRNGRYVPLDAQSPAMWDAALIDEAEGLLRRASSFATIGRFQLEAALQSAHVHRRRSDENNWPAVVALYDALLAITRSPVVAVNRALAVAEVSGACAALAALDTIRADPRLTEYQPYWAARAELLMRTNAPEEARHAYDIAIGLTRDPLVRDFLLQRRAR